MTNASGQWDCMMKSPLGDHRIALSITTEGDSFSGQAESEFGPLVIANGRIDGDRLRWSTKIQNPVEIALDFEVTISGDTLAGEGKTMLLGSFPITGNRRA